jgi:hypothetical protein
MANDIEIRVRVGNDTGSGLTAVNTSLRQLKQNAQNAGQALTTLTTRATAASVALRSLHDGAESASRALRTLRDRAVESSLALAELRTRATGVSNGLRTMGTRTEAAHGRLGDLSDRTRTLRTELDGLDTSARRAGAGLGDLRGGLGGGGGGGDGAGAFGDLKAALISLAPAAIPVAAALAPIAVQAGAATTAMAAFGAAIIPQIQSFADAAKAQKTYQDNVGKTGAMSQAAMTSQKAYQASVAGMPPATYKAAIAFQVLGEKYKGWSDGLAGFTMVPVTRSFAVLQGILPKLTPMVEESSLQLSRLVTAAGGGINSTAFDELSQKVSDFANNSLKSAVDGTLHFSRVLSEGKMSGPIASFFAYAKANGPAVKDTLSNLSTAVVHLLDAASQAGPGLLTLVNAFAKLVAAVPASLLANLMQVYTAFKLIKLAGAGVGAAAGGVTTLTTRIVALRAASVAAGGGVAGLRAAFATLGTAAKASVIVAGIAAVAVVLTRLSAIGKKAPPDVDKMATAIGNLGRTGKASGEALRSYGADLGGLADSINTLANPSNADRVQQFLVGLIGMDSTPVADAKKDVDAFDKSLASLVKGGNADLANAAFNRAVEATAKAGHSTKGLKGQLDDYKSALADAAFEQQLAADSMGLFGQQAMDVQAKLAAQKQSADGLRQSIQALNDVNRQGLGGMIGFEAAIDAASKAAKDNGQALRMVHGQLDLGSEKARNEAQALSDLAAKTDSATASARESGASWSAVNKIYDRGRGKLIAAAEAMGLTRAEAQKLAGQILKAPDKTARLKGNLDDLKSKLAAAKADLKTVPASKRTKLQASIDQLKAQIRAAKAAIASLKGKSVTITTYSKYVSVGKRPGEGTVLAPGKATGGVIGAYADGGVTRGSLSLVGEQGPELVRLPVGSTVYPAGQSRRMMDDGEPYQAYAKGGKVTKAQQARNKAQAQARSQAWPDLTISAFGQMAGYRRSELGAALGSPDSLSGLVDALNKWKGIIKAATSGATERGLLKSLSSTGAALIRQEKALSKVNSALDKAKDKLSSLKDAAAQLASGIKSGIVSGGSIVNGAQNTGAWTGGQGLIQQMGSKVADAQSLASALAQLKKRGLNAQSLSEIAQAGVEGGGLETATRLLGSSSADIKQINTLEKQLTKAAGAAGKTTADAMYAKQIKATDHLVDSLKKQQEKLSKSMDHLAKVMENAIKKGFGGKATGGIIGAATGGARGGLTWVGEQGPELARLPYGSTVYPAGQSRQMAMAGGGGGQPIQVNLVLDGKVVARALVDPIRGVVNNIAGGSVQKAFGRGNG